MAGTVSVSPGVLWSASSRLFYWVITDIAKRATDVELAEHLNEIDRENLGWFGFGDITLSQRREVRRIIAGRLVDDADAEFASDMPARMSALVLLQDLAIMVSGGPEPMIIDFLHAEFRIWQQRLPPSAAAKFEEFPRPEGTGRAVRVSVETPPWEAEVTVWESGEADLVSGNLATGDMKPYQHMELTTRLDVRGLLDDLAWAVSS
jgi:hypothetical protein